MSGENAAQPKQESTGRRRIWANLFWIPAGLFALAGIFSALNSKIARSVLFFSLSVIWIATGVARQARKDSAASGSGSAKQADAS